MRTRRTKRLLAPSFALLTAAALGLTGAVAVVPALPASAADTSSIDGYVFRDFNSNGIQDTVASATDGVAVDVGIPGVVVTAYTADGAVYGSTVVSAADGAYTLAGSESTSQTLRVEFTGLPDGYSETPVYSSSGDRSGTSVQFVSTGTENVNFGASAANDYSQDEPPVVTAIQYAGIPSGNSGNQPAVVVQPYSDNSTTQVTGFADRTTLANFSQVGAVWGVAWNAPQEEVFVAATYKRHSGLGALGLGGIYLISDAVSNGEIATSGSTVSNWLDVASLGVDVGTAQSNAARGLGNGNEEARDIDAFEQAGKIGIGGMATSADGNLLYFVNLYEKTLVTLDISDLDTPALVSETSLALGVGERPWALSVQGSALYVGYVETGETLVNGIETATPGVSGADAGLSASVISTSLPVTATSTFTSVLDIPLDYAKGTVYKSNLAPQSDRWNTWADTWTWPADGTTPAGSVAQTTSNASQWHIYPSAILQSISFDADNYLTLGFGDRSSIQGGNRNWGAVTTGNQHYETGASGDLLLASPSADGTSWTIESAGTAGTRTAGGTPADRATNNEGPGGGEFYADRNNLGRSTSHNEVALGAVAIMPGTNEVLATEYDPLSAIRVSGLAWLSTDDGSAIAGYNHVVDPGGSTSTTGTAGTFQKGGGLGGIQVLSEVAPLEIGNRVWFDADQDGIQDADESALSGVTVQLFSGEALLAEVTTGADGSYFFSSDADSEFYAAGLVAHGGDYTIAFSTPDSGNVPFSEADATLFGTVPWSKLALTNADQGSDLIDSDADSSGVITYTAGAAGVSDHSLDAGFIANATFTVAKALADDSGPAGDEETFSITATAVDFRGNPYVVDDSPLVVSAGTTSDAVAVPVGTRVTITEANDGKYRGAVVSPSTATLVSGEEVTEFTVTNDLFDAGYFTVTKAVTGPGASLIADDQSFTVSYTYDGLDTPKTLVVINGQTSAQSDAIPYGTEVTITESAPSGNPEGVGWDTPVWSTSSDNGALTDNGDGSSTITIDDAATFALQLSNPTTVSPKVTILRGDQVEADYHAADTIGDAEVYTPGETRTIVFTATNSGTEELKDVVLGDSTASGTAVGAITWTFPDGSTVTAPAGTDVEWKNSFDGVSTWAPGAVITGTASLTIGLGDQAHIATATVDAVGVVSDTAVNDANDYNAFTGGIQIIKYDANSADPVTRDGDGNWIVPVKADVAAAQDADTTENAVDYPVNTAQKVRLVASNTGTTTLTNISLADLTTDGPALNGSWIADLSALGGPAEFDFADGAVWPGVLKPGQSFFAESSLTLPAEDTHAGEVTVVASIVVPELGDDGTPNGEPTYDSADAPVVALRDGAAATVTDDDPFNAKTGVGPTIGIQLGDGDAAKGTITNDANTMAAAEVYLAGETRPIVFSVTNTGTEPLREVTIDGEVFSGPEFDAPIVWTFPDGSTATSTLVDGKHVVTWPNTFDGTSTWAPGDVITGVSSLTLNASDQPHVSNVVVNAIGNVSEIAVRATDPYNAFTGAIQVIEYDGATSDPAVKDWLGNWIIPSKSDVKPGIDADTADSAVVFEAGVAQAVRWVVTNTGTTAMTNITLVNALSSGVAVAEGWTADFSDLGGPEDYNFASSGPWTGVLLPGQSFYASGSLTLAAGETHSNDVTVTGRVIIPEVTDAGLPTGSPSSLNGVLQLAVFNNGSAFTVTATDPFNARALTAAESEELRLAYTGQAIGYSLVIGLALLLGGGFLMMVRQRQQRRS